MDREHPVQDRIRPVRRTPGDAAYRGLTTEADRRLKQNGRAVPGDVAEGAEMGDPVVDGDVRGGRLTSEEDRLEPGARVELERVELRAAW
jgi:hypothetical protein